MKIAILGANSHLATDLAFQFAEQRLHEVYLFCRNPEVLQHTNLSAPTRGTYPCLHYSALHQHSFDAILNFVGAGDPARVADMGASIFDVTLEYDGMALDYLRRQPKCQYVFMSSGAVFGGSFPEPVGVDTSACLPINTLGPKYWYGAAKLHAESRHRAWSSLAIVDLRIFNYFSQRQNLEAKYFLSEALKCLRDKTVLRTDATNVVRDYLGPTDLYQLICSVLASAPLNRAVDCYSAAPVDKTTLLEYLRTAQGLRYEVLEGCAMPKPTGTKTNYYSHNRIAASLGYVPQWTSLENIEAQVRALRETWI